MSLRLDPRYHGVIVARVRPKEAALIIKGQFAILQASNKVAFRFVWSECKEEWIPRSWSALVKGRKCYQKDALEELGLR